jgi:hypothetical protein
MSLLPLFPIICYFSLVRLQGATGSRPIGVIHIAENSGSLIESDGPVTRIMHLFRILSGIVRKADTSIISSLIQIIGGRLRYSVLCLVTDFQTMHCL